MSPAALLRMPAAPTRRLCICALDSEVSWMKAIVVLGDNSQRLRDGLSLLGARLAALLPLVVQVPAGRAEVAQVLHVLRALLCRQLKVLLGVRQSLHVRRMLSLHRVKVLFTSGDLLLLGLLER